MTQFNANIPEEMVKILSDIIKHFEFGFIEDSAEIKLCGRRGLLVWDYIIWNELTFVDTETKQKQSLFTSVSDNDTRGKFNYYVSQNDDDNQNDPDGEENQNHESPEADYYENNKIFADVVNHFINNLAAFIPGAQEGNEKYYNHLKRSMENISGDTDLDSIIRFISAAQHGNKKAYNAFAELVKKYSDPEDFMEEDE